MPCTAARCCDAALGLELAQSGIDRLLREPREVADIAQGACSALDVQGVQYLKRAVRQAEPLRDFMVYRFRFADETVEAPQMF